MWYLEIIRRKIKQELKQEFRWDILMLLPGPYFGNIQTNQSYLCITKDNWNTNWNLSHDNGILQE